MEKTYRVEWWEEINDCSTDLDQEVVAESAEEAIERVVKRNPRARHITVREL